MTVTPATTGAARLNGGSKTDWVEVARFLRPLIESEAAASGARANTSDEVVKAFKDTGLYWLGFPVDWGGGDADASILLAVAEEIASYDLSTGWTYLVGMSGSVIASVFLEESTARELFAGPGRKVTCGFANGAKGTATRNAEGSYRVNEHRNPFGSGTMHADRAISLVKIVDDRGEPVPGADGEPETRFIWIDRNDITWHPETWLVNGLSGSGSGDYTLHAQDLDAKWVSTKDPSKVRPGTATNYGYIGVSYLFHVGIALGAARHALEGAAKLSEGKRRATYVIDENPLFLRDFAEMDAQLQAARTWAHQVHSDAWAEATSQAITEMTIARIIQVSTYTNALAERIVSKAALWAGSAAIPKSSPIGRLIRDMRVAANHVLVDPASTYIQVVPPILNSYRE